MLLDDTKFSKLNFQNDSHLNLAAETQPVKSDYIFVNLPTFVKLFVIRKIWQDDICPRLL